MFKTKFNGVDTNIGAVIALTGVGLSFLLPGIGFIAGGIYGVKTLVAANVGAGLFLKTASAIGGAVIGAVAGRIAITPVALASTVFGAGVRYSNNLVLGSLKAVKDGFKKVFGLSKRKKAEKVEKPVQKQETQLNTTKVKGGFNDKSKQPQETVPQQIQTNKQQPKI